ncbi:6-phosphogluconate dehydrogenase NAD-binding protein [Saccharomonospora azurea SZMC 14600]|nr:6-phosphogluconate dehydrogenase NAD-binding protein [Saccharomonospora azurea SZMC 14600]
MITTGNTREPVTVIGLGPMGQAMVTALLDAGHAVTVWNRTASRADTVADALAASELVILSLTDYQAMHDILDPATDALAGRLLVNLSSDTPQRTTEAAARLARHGARLLVGGVMVSAELIGTEHSYVFYSGSSRLLRRAHAHARRPRPTRLPRGGPRARPALLPGAARHLPHVTGGPPARHSPADGRGRARHDVRPLRHADVRHDVVLPGRRRRRTRTRRVSRRRRDDDHDGRHRRPHRRSQRGRRNRHRAAACGAVVLPPRHRRGTRSERLAQPVRGDQGALTSAAGANARRAASTSRSAKSAVRGPVRSSQRRNNGA